MARQKSKASYRRGLIDNAINNAQARIEQERKAAQEAAKAQIPDYAKGMSLDDVNRIIDSYNSQNTIPKLEQNTTPTTPSISDELERMKKAKADTTTPRTEGEQKAIDTYYDSLMKASGQTPTTTMPTNTPSVDYKAEIERMNAIKANTTTPRTEGENQAIETYLKGLEEAQRYLDSQKPKTTVKKTANGTTVKTETPESKKIGTVEIKADGTKKYTKTMSANEQRDHERALMAQAKAVANDAKKTAVPKDRVLSPNEQRDLDRATEAIAKAKEREKVETQTESKVMPTAAKERTEELQFGRMVQATPTSTSTPQSIATDYANYLVETGNEDVAQEYVNDVNKAYNTKVENERKAYEAAVADYKSKHQYDERGFRTNESLLNDFIDPNKKLTKDEKNQAKALINTYLDSDQQIKKLHDTRNPHYSYDLTPEQSELYAKINALEGKLNGATSAFTGVTNSLPFASIALDKLEQQMGVPEQANFSNTVANARRQHPVLETAGEFAGTAAQYGLINASPLGNIGGEGTLWNLGRGQIADTLLDTAPNTAYNIYQGKYKNADGTFNGGELTKDILLNEGANLLYNLGGEYIPRLWQNKKLNDIPRVEAPEQLNPIEMAAKNAEIENVVQELNSPNPIRVGKASIIRDPYIGEKPIQNIAKRERVPISTKDYDNAVKNISISNVDSKIQGVNQKTLLSKVYETLFGEEKTAFDVPVDGMTFGNKAYNVTVNKNAIGKIISDPNMSPEKLSVIDNLNDIIRKSEYLDSGKYVDYKNTGKKSNAIRYDYFETDVKIGNTDYVVTFDVEVVPGKNNYKTHKIINEINLTPTSGEMGSVPTAQELSGLSQATNNVADSLSTSNVEQIGKSVNPNNDLYSPHIFEDIADSQADEIIAPAVKQADEGKNPIQETLDNEFPNAQTPEMRAKQNAEVVSQKVQPKDLTQADSLENQDVRRWIDSLEMPDEVRTDVSKKLDEMDSIIEKFNKSKTKDEIMDSMNEFEKKYSEIEDALKKNAKAVEYADTGVKEEKKKLANALKGQVINLSNLSKAEIPDTTMRDLNNILYTGHGSGRFVRKGGTPIDSVFNEIDMQTGGALTTYMMRNGLDPEITENQAKGLIEYMQSLKSASGKAIREEAYQGGLLDDTFERMIKSASERGIDIDENALRKKQFVSAFRTHNQGNFGLTDEELNNKYFNTQNENFRFLKGDRAGDMENAAKNLETNYEGTVNKLLDKPTTQQFTPQEVDEGFMAWRRELDNARETGDYQKAANIMYRMTQDAHEKGAGLQAYAAYKKNTPAGVVLDATEAARDMAVDKTSKKYVAKIDDLVNKVNELQNSGLSFEEQERQLMEYMREIQKRGYKNGINGFEQMKELLKTGQETREMLYEDLKKAGRVTTLEDFKEMLKTGRLTREMVYEDLNKAGHSISIKDVDDMLKSARGVDAVGIKDILYEANKLPNIDAQAQKKIADLAQEMFGKELTDAEKRKYINQINMVLSSQRNWSIKDKAVEIAHIMMLSGTKTHLRNVLANIGMLPQAGLARKISAVGQNAYAFFNKDYTPTQAFFVGKDARKLASEALEKMGGASAIAEGVADKYSNRLANQIGANYMFGTGKKNIVSKASDALDKIPFLKSAREGVGNAGNRLLKKVGSEGAYDAMDSDISLLENYRQLIYGSLSGLEDNPFVKRNFEDRLASYIKAQGIKTLSEIPEEAIDIARAEALKATFKDENAWTSLFTSLKKFPVVGETLLPFTKTPANLIARSIDYSPIGLARELAGIAGHVFGKNNKFTRETVGEMFDELAKGLSGTALGAAAVLGLYANGVITGKEDEDYNIAKYMQEEGWRPYALSTKGLTDFVNEKLGTNFDLGDNYIPFDWLQPSTTNIVAMEELYDEMTNGDKISDKTIDDIFQRVKSIGGSYVSSLLEQSTLQNVSELFGSKYNDQSTGENLVDAVMQLPTRYFSGALSDIAKLEDTTKREYYSKNKPVETAYNLAVSKTPFASKTLPAKYDLFGNEVKTADSQAGNVIKTLFDVSNSAKKTDDEHYNYIDTLNSQTTTGDYIPTTPARNIQLDDESKKMLDNKEYSKLRQISGQERTRLMDNARQNEEFNSLSADEKAYVLTQLDKVALAKGDLGVVENPKMSKDVSEMLDMTDDERISKLAGDAKKMTNKSALDAQNLPNSDFFVEAMQNGEDLSKWKEYGEILNNAEKDDSEKRRKLYESGYLEKAIEYGVDGYDSKSAMKAFKDGEYENYAGYRQELERTGMSDSEDNWNEYMKQIHAKGEADLTNVKTIAPEQTASVQQELVSLGMADEIYSVQKYDRAKGEIPTLSPAQFVTTYNTIDSKDKKNNSISQTEIIAYLNDTNVKDNDKAMQIWNAYLSNPTESTIPVLKDGKWSKKTTRKKKKS